jgi:hypothetical protein
MMTPEANVWRKTWRFLGIAYGVEIPLMMGAVWLDYRLVFVVLLVAAGLSAFALLTLRCPSCEKLVTNRSIGFGRVAVQIPLGLPERVCSKCGHDLRGSAKRASPEIQ